MRETDQKIYIYGKHVLGAALERGGKALERVFLVKGADTGDIRERARARHIPVEAMSQESLPRDVADESHQGAIGVVVPGRLVICLEDFMRTLTVKPDTLFVLFDELQDPQNVGAIIRSATALGASAILIPERRQSPITGSVLKASAGTAFSIPLLTIGNVNTTIRDLKERGFWVYGIEAGGTTDISSERFLKPSVIVLGGEGRGIREKTLEHCDIVLSINMHPRCESLNVSAAAAIALHAWSRRHPTALAKIQGR